MIEQKQKGVNCMSQSYWTVSGIGINVEDLHLKRKLSPKKVLDLVDVGYSDGEFETEDDLNDEVFGMDAYEIVEMLTIKHDERKLLEEGSTGNMDMGVFLLYAPIFPWQMTEEEKNLTQEEVEDYIANVIQNITDMPYKDIREKIGEIYVPGCG